MKRLLFTGILLSALAACQSGSDKDAAKAKKQTELETLKKERTTIEDKIKKLEGELDEKKQGENIIVKTETMQPATFEHYVSLQGIVASETSVDVHPMGNGTITGIFVKMGDAVVAGQTIARLDNSAMLASIEPLKQNLTLAKTAYERQKNLWDQKVGSEIQYLQAKTNYESLQKQIDAVQQQADLSVVKAPVSGVIDQVYGKTGEMGNALMPIVRIVNLNNLKVTADLAENYLGKVKAGDQVNIKFPSIDKEVTKNITTVGRVISTLNRSFGIEIQLDGQYKDALSPNMVADLKVKDYKKEEAYVVPSNLIQLGDDGYFVFVAVNDNGKELVKKKMVNTGLTYNNRTEILSGLTKGDIIITTGYQDLNQGQEITISNTN